MNSSASNHLDVKLLQFHVPSHNFLSELLLDNFFDLLDVLTGPPWLLAAGMVFLDVDPKGAKVGLDAAMTYDDEAFLVGFWLEEDLTNETFAFFSRVVSFVVVDWTVPDNLFSFILSAGGWGVIVFIESFNK